MKASRRINKQQHIERMGDRAARRAKDARLLVEAAGLSAELASLRAIRRRNGVGRPPRKP